MVPAFQRIRNSRACGLVQKYRKELHTIGVLTMADRAYENIRANDPYYSLKMRLDKKADDCIELTNGYIAVKNRDKVTAGVPKVSLNVALHLGFECKRSAVQFCQSGDSMV